MMNTSSYEVVVVGAGQAGLAVGHFLRRQGRRFVILERADHIVPAWRERWDSLTLFTARRYSALPGLPFPGDPDGYPTRDEVIAYLDRYAEAFELPVELNSGVKELDRGDDGRFRLELDELTITADQVVVATGPFQNPYVPKLAQSLARDVFQTHAVGYRRADEVPSGTVLMVGGGNTGFQIAKELSATHKVVLSVGSRQTPLPQRLLGRDLFWWLTKTRVLDKTIESRLGRKLSTRETLIGSSPRELKKRYGVELRTARRRRRRSRDPLRGWQRPPDRRRHLGDWVPARLLVDQAPYLRRGAPAPSPWRHGCPRAVLPRTRLAVHARIGTDWLGQRRRRIHRQADSRDARIEGAPVRAHTRRRRRVGSSSLDRKGLAMDDSSSHSHTQTIEFPRETDGLPEARKTEVVELDDGDEFELDIMPVKKRIGDATVRMLAYNGSVPGPTLKVPQGGTITVHVTNHGDLDATVHWHGLRLENRYDGTHDTQAPIPIGETFTYKVHVPDAGAFWYHPHIREDYGRNGPVRNILATQAIPTTGRRRTASSC
jgi:thioredoxin reductase